MDARNRNNDARPLAMRMRPTSLQGLVGQEHILSPDKLLYRAIQADRLGSIILYGPPGTGKTTVASVIAHETKGRFVQINATTSGKKDMEKAVKDAQDSAAGGRRTILFVDEIHRFNKAQQDFLLPHVESGLIVLVGATTENPYFEVNKALLSRSRIFELKPLSPENVMTVLLRACTHPDGVPGTRIDPDALRFLSDACSGDVRGALNALELGVLTTDPDPATGRVRITLDTAQECIQKKAVAYDKDGDGHYDAISAYIESMRGSDPQAALYYLARMLTAGEDIKYIARWLMIMSCTDVGMANPQALCIASACATACDWVGMPKAAYILADATIFIATSPKTPTVMQATDAAMDIVARTGSPEIPDMFKDCSYAGAISLNRGANFICNYDYPNNYVTRQHLPDSLKDIWLYQPSRIDYEAQIAAHMNRLLHDERERVARENAAGTARTVAPPANDPEGSTDPT